VTRTARQAHATAGLAHIVGDADTGDAVATLAIDAASALADSTVTATARRIRRCTQALIEELTLALDAREVRTAPARRLGERARPVVGYARITDANFAGGAAHRTLVAARSVVGAQSRCPLGRTTVGAVACRYDVDAVAVVASLPRRALAPWRVDADAILTSTPEPAFGRERAFGLIGRLKKEQLAATACQYQRY